jgi:hypothetical protein
MEREVKEGRQNGGEAKGGEGRRKEGREVKGGTSIHPSMHTYIHACNFFQPLTLSFLPPFPLSCLSAFTSFHPFTFPDHALF